MGMRAMSDRVNVQVGWQPASAGLLPSVSSSVGISIWHGARMALRASRHPAAPANPPNPPTTTGGTHKV